MKFRIWNRCLLELIAIDHFDILTPKGGLERGTNGNYEKTPKLFTLRQILLESNL